jgi:hypothetical protein
MGAGRPAVAGDRSVNIQGDVSGVIVTGDNSYVVNFPQGADHGALLEALSAALVPKKRLRPRPVRELPAAFAGTVDREAEVRAILDGIASHETVNVHGETGVGKTYALLRALNSDDPRLAGNLAYIHANQGLDDVLQRVFETWYECDRPCQLSPTQVRRDLAQIAGVLALDSVTLDREAAQQLSLAVPGCRLVVASRDRVLWEGIGVAIRGLERDFSRAVIEQQLGRAISGDEDAAAERLATQLAGNPERIREAVATAQEQGRSLAALGATLSSLEPVATVAHDKLEAAGPEGRRLLAALALFGGAEVGDRHLREIAAVPDFDAVVDGALRRRDIRGEGGRYRIGAVLAVAPGSLDLTSVAHAALAHFINWSSQLRAEPLALLKEGDALLALLRWATAAGLSHEVIGLGRNIDSAFALGRRFGSWREVLELVRAAARDAGDRYAEAWALHQLGTRAMSLGDIDVGAALLRQAIAMRRELDDGDGAEVSINNLGLASRSRWLGAWIVGHSVLFGVLLAGLVLLTGGVLAATLGVGGHHKYHATSSGTVVVLIKGQGSVVSDAIGIDCPSRCKASFRASTPVKLDATAGARASFSGWHGACSGQKACTVRAMGTRTVFASFVADPPPPPGGATLSVRTQGAGMVRSQPAGIACPGTCTATFRVGQTLTLLPTAGPNISFSSWSGDCAGAGACQLTMSASHSVTAVFAAARLTVDVAGDGAVITRPGGISCPVHCAASFSPDATVTLTARPGSGAALRSWTGDCTGTAQCTVKMNSDRDVGAEFSGTSPPTLTVATAGSGSGIVTSADGQIDCGATCSASYPTGGQVTLTAGASMGSTFAGWSGACSGNSSSCTVTVSSAQTATATFDAAPLSFALTVSKAGGGGGSVASTDGKLDCGSTCSVTYSSGAPVVLDAAPAVDSSFAGWSGACTGTASSCTVTMSAAEQVTATFSVTPPASEVLTVKPGGSGSGVVAGGPSSSSATTPATEKIACHQGPAGTYVQQHCSATYPEGTSVMLTAAPASGTTFTGWSGACSGTGTTCTLAMDSSETASATFAATDTLSVAVHGSGTVTSGDGQIDCSGSAGSQGCSGTYPGGGSVTLTATPSPGASFDGWSGSCTGTSASCTVTATPNESATALFSANFQ